MNLPINKYLLLTIIFILVIVNGFFWGHIQETKKVSSKVQEIANITDQEKLKEIVFAEKNTAFGGLALYKITDMDFIETIVLDDTFPIGKRHTACSLIKNDDCLIQIAQKVKSGPIQVQIITRIDDVVQLNILAGVIDNDNVKKYIHDKIAALSEKEKK